MPKIAFGIDPFTLALLVGGGALAGGALGRKKDKTTQISTLSGGQQNVASPLAKFLSSRVGQGLQGFGGQRIAGMSSFEQSGLGALSSFLGSETPLSGDITGALQKLLAGQPSTEVNSGLTRDFFRKSIADPARRRFEEETLPLVRESFVGSGQFNSTARAETERRARRDLDEALLGKETELVFADEQARRQLSESALQRALGASGIAPGAARSLEEGDLRRAQAGTTIGALPRQLAQAQLDFEFNEFIRTQPELSPVIQQALAFLGIPTTATFFEPGQSFGEGALQGGALTAALATA